MPITERFEDFREFVFKPIGYLIDKSDSDITTFCSQLPGKYEFVLGEARRIKEEFDSDKKSSDQFFKDIHIKVSTAEERLIKTTSEGIIYKPLAHLIRTPGKIEDSYFAEIYPILKKSSKQKKISIVNIPGIIRESLKPSKIRIGVTTRELLNYFKILRIKIIE
jgi:hypothetical protein